jgi:phage terminase large subunit
MSNNFIITTNLKRILLNRKTHNNNRISLIQGGTSAGKTYSIISILINIALSKSVRRISVVSTTLPHLKRGAISDFLKIMTATHRYDPNKWNRTDKIYSFDNGSIIEFFSADDSNKLRGGRRDILFINECNLIDQESYTQLAIRTSGDIYLDYNPTHKFWGHSLGVEPLILTYNGNEALQQSIIDELESKRELAKTSKYWANWCKVYLDGEIGGIEGQIFTNYEYISIIPEEAELIGYGLDYGYTNDPTAIVKIYKYNNKIIAEEICYKTKMMNSDIIKLLKGEDNRLAIYAESAEPKSNNELKRAGLNIIPVVKGKDSILYGIQLMQNYDFQIKGLNLKNEFENYTWKTDKNGNSLNTPIDKFNHLIDALRYFMMMKFGVKKTTGKYVIR